MAKKILISNSEVDNILSELKAQILGSKFFGSFEYKQNFSKDERKATIVFTPKAWIKMTALVKEFDTEVQWHGLVNRLDNNKFEIYDILVPPHVVTGSTVTSDPERYSTWINELDDETFNHLRYHGHSHVNMGVSPSGVDTKYRQDVVTQLPVPENDGEDSFYIFLILNKRGEWSGEIYDITNNALYDTGDISIEVKVDDGDELLSKFIAEARKQATKETPVTTPTKSEKSSFGSVTYYGRDYYNDNLNSKKSGKGKDKTDKSSYKSYYGGWVDDDEIRDPFYYGSY